MRLLRSRWGESRRNSQSINGKLPSGCSARGIIGPIVPVLMAARMDAAMPSSGPLTAIHSMGVRLHVAHVGAGKGPGRGMQRGEKAEGLSPSRGSARGTRRDCMGVGAVGSLR